MTDTCLHYNLRPSSSHEESTPGGAKSEEESDDYVTVSSLRSVAPEGWTMFTHPRGSIYFRNSSCRVIVDEDIRIPANLEKANEFCQEMLQLVRMASDMEAHMALGADTSVCVFVNHRHCVAGYDHSKILDHIVREMSVDALLRGRRLYWSFVSLHPSHHPCHPRSFHDAIDALQSFYHDHLIDGSHSIAPFSKAECEQLLDILHRNKDDTTKALPSLVSLLGWILKDVYSFRSGQHFGQITWTAMRSYRKSLSSPPDLSPRESFATKLFLAFIVNGPFFGIPQTYLAHVKQASQFRGHLAGLKTSWESYTHQLVREYSDFILIATVLLSATVGMLTINDVGQIARVAAMISSFASLGSITIGVFFVWRHQRNTRMPSSFTYLHNARNNTFGLSGHATLLSLPPVLLVWSIIAFAVSALAYALQDISLVSASAAAWVILAIFAVVFVAVMVGVYTFSTIWSWQSQDTWWRNLSCWSRAQRASRTV